MLVALFNEFKSSIKSPDTEEKLDLVLYRPVGFLVAKVANFLTMTPTMVSLLGLYIGLVSSYYYLRPHNNSALIWASFYLVLSGIFDSADGQLARISNQTTRIGIVLDGICDSIVTIAVYAACIWPFFTSYGFYFVIVVCFALYLHSCQCAILDFYHREYLYFGYGKTDNDTYWNPGFDDGIRNIENSQGFEKFINKLRLTWIKKQQFLTSRTDYQRQTMRNYLLSNAPDEKKIFLEIYRRHNLWLLPFWRLIGVNAHTVLIIIFMFYHRFDVYLITFDLVIFNLIILVVGIMQKKSDQKLFSELKLNTHEE
ncbi:MAG: CDP-alcohol phosphatidyltransferase family protein [Bacteriovorax sp.]|nr:CDP-alcohol phosphatidyltransferase family protein [Bacteriovorax sp.]